MQDIIRRLLAELGEDPTREGLVDTPGRVDKSLRFLTSGYTADVDTVINNALFSVEYNEMVIVRDIDFYSLCEHHLLPFFGKAHVAECLMEKIQPLGVAVVMEATHLCKAMRGVEKQNSVTVTSAMRGLFHQDARTRQEFLKLIGK